MRYRSNRLDLVGLQESKHLQIQYLVLPLEDLELQSRWCLKLLDEQQGRIFFSLVLLLEL